MVKVVESKYGLVAFVESATYFNGDLMSGSMGSIADKTGAKYVMVLGDKVREDDVDVAKAEEMVEMVMNAPKRPYRD